MPFKDNARLEGEKTIYGVYWDHSLLRGARDNLRREKEEKQETRFDRGGRLFWTLLNFGC